MRFKSGRYTGINRHLRMHSAELRAWLGLPSRLPPDFEWSGTRGGLDFVVRAKTKKGMEKRVFVRCPECPGVHWVEAGHLHQHTEASHPQAS